MWAAPEGVYALFSATCNPLAGERCGGEGLALQFNDGRGWESLYRTQPASVFQLTGLSVDQVLLLGGSASGFGISSFRDGEVELDQPLSDPLNTAIFVAGPDEAYAVDGTTFLEYAEGKWSVSAVLPGPGTDIWANDEVVIVVGPDQGFYVRAAGDPAFTPLEDVPAGNYWAVWGFAADDVWAGNQAGQLIHYDGETWSVLPTGSEDTSGGGIAQLWGADKTLYFRTDSELGRATGDAIELLIPRQRGVGDSPRLRMTGLWGLSSSEVFVTLTDSEYASYACGEQFILWFDGDEFHQF